LLKKRISKLLDRFFPPILRRMTRPGPTGPERNFVAVVRRVLVGAGLLVPDRNPERSGRNSDVFRARRSDVIGIRVRHRVLKSMFRNFLSSLTKRRNKLERLSLASLSYLGLIFSSKETGFFLKFLLLGHVV
jgi:hypothetical protein